MPGSHLEIRLNNIFGHGFTRMNTDTDVLVRCAKRAGCIGFSGTLLHYEVMSNKCLGHTLK